MKVILVIIITIKPPSEKIYFPILNPNMMASSITVINVILKEHIPSLRSSSSEDSPSQMPSSLTLLSSGFWLVGGLLTPIDPKIFFAVYLFVSICWTSEVVRRPTNMLLFLPPWLLCFLFLSFFLHFQSVSSEINKHLWAKKERVAAALLCN